MCTLICKMGSDPEICGGNPGSAGKNICVQKCLNQRSWPVTVISYKWNAEENGQNRRRVKCNEFDIYDGLKVHPIIQLFHAYTISRKHAVGIQNSHNIPEYPLYPRISKISKSILQNIPAK